MHAASATGPALGPPGLRHPGGAYAKAPAASGSPSGLPTDRPRSSLLAARLDAAPSQPTLNLRTAPAEAHAMRRRGHCQFVNACSYTLNFDEDTKAELKTLRRAKLPPTTRR